MQVLCSQLVVLLKIVKNYHMSQERCHNTPIPLSLFSNSGTIEYYTIKNAIDANKSIKRKNLFQKKTKIKIHFHDDDEKKGYEEKTSLMRIDVLQSWFLISSIFVSSSICVCFNEISRTLRSQIYQYGVRYWTVKIYAIAFDDGT